MRIHNEKGAMTIMVVMAVAVTIFSTLSTIYVYIINRAKHQARIKEAYQLSQVMEQFGRLTRQAYDSADAMSNPAVNCPASRYWTEGGVEFCFPPKMSADQPSEQCVQHLGRWYCMKGTSETSASINLNPKNVAELRFEAINQVTNASKLNKWIAKLDLFFDDNLAVQVPQITAYLDPLMQKKLEPQYWSWLVREARADSCPSFCSSLKTGDMGLICTEGQKGGLEMQCDTYKKYCARCGDLAGKNNLVHGGESVTETSSASVPGRVHENENGGVGGNEGENSSNVIGENETPDVPTPEVGNPTIPSLPTSPNGPPPPSRTVQLPASCREHFTPSCLSYCEAGSQVCQGRFPTATVNSPVCAPGSTANNCMPCDAANGCLKLTYCLADHHNSNSTGCDRRFEQNVKIIR